MDFAFDYARRHNCRRITCVHKANIMKLTDGLFLSIFRQTAQRYNASLHSKTASLVADDQIVDNAAMQMVSKPEQFDVIVTSNLYGNVLANIGSGLVGGAGLIPGYNIGHNCILFEPGARHAGRSLAGLNVGNPVAMLLSATLMLRHLDYTKHSQVIYNAIISVLSEHPVCIRI